jgi:outer membrane protein TolC
MHTMRFTLLLLLALNLPAQEPLSLRDAVRVALRENKTLAAAAAGVQAAASRVTEARGGRLPKVNYSESWARSDNPVFVFSSLLTQHQFTANNFAIGPLNRPDALNNFASQVTVEQPLYDAGQTRLAVRGAELGREMTGEARRGAEMQVIAGVLRAYWGVLLSGESWKAAREALRSAEADLARAESVRAAGMSTDVDVLSIRVHLAAVREQEIRRAADAEVARAALNEAMGLPLDAKHTLTTPLAALAAPEPAAAEMETSAVAARPEARGLEFAASLARTQQAAARATLLPQVFFRGAFEADRQRFATGGGANWMAGVSLRWNLFNGFSDKARIEETGFAVRRAEAEQARAGSAIRLEVRRASADLRAARERIQVAQAAVAEAEESLRITQNRYAAGLADVTSLLRTETALLESRTRHLAAVHDQRIAAAMLEFAAGRLTADSEVLN